MSSFDVIVVGSGPAGVSCALKCTKLGYETLLLEKGKPGRHKPCGGVVPPLCVSMLEEEFNLKIPHSVMSSPNSLGLYYVPPSGSEKGGKLKNYRLLNIDRDLFDQWLRHEAEIAGVSILYQAEFLKYRNLGDSNTLVAKIEGRPTELKYRHLVGADGCFSRVRRQVYPDLKPNSLTIIQEFWQTEGDIEDCFYVFFKEDMTPSYAYLIPKNGLLVVGTGIPAGYPVPLSACLDKFKETLHRELGLDLVSLAKKEFAAIPYDTPVSGKDGAILIGDAAGFCNSFSGEGIRLAIESGILAGEAIDQACHSSVSLSSIYDRLSKELREFIDRTHQFSIALTDERREKFIKAELQRSCLFNPGSGVITYSITA